MWNGSSGLGWNALVGRSATLLDVVATLRQLCGSLPSEEPPTVLLSGETGTGKGLMARLIHENGFRSREAFVSTNCATVSDWETLFNQAKGGTLYLDALEALSRHHQGRLLAILDRINAPGNAGSISPRDVRIISSAPEGIALLAREGLVQYELFQRLSVVTVQVPPLRAREEDVILLAEAFIRSTCEEYGIAPRQLTPAARVSLTSYSWPGNVRELRNKIENIILVSSDESITEEHFGEQPECVSGTIKIKRSSAGVRVDLPPEGVAFEELEREVLKQALGHCAGNVSRAARFLSISRQTLIYRMKKHGLAARESNANDEKASGGGRR